MVQPFLTAASLDLSATLCVVAFSVAIPQPCAATGVVAGFWHIRWIAGVAVLVGIGVHSAGYVRLELREPGDPEPGAPG